MIIELRHTIYLQDVLAGAVPDDILVCISERGIDSWTYDTDAVIDFYQGSVNIDPIPEKELLNMLQAMAVCLGKNSMTYYTRIVREIVADCQMWANSDKTKLQAMVIGKQMEDERILDIKFDR